MKKLFIEPNEITDKIRNNKGGGQFIYDRIKEINEKIPLQIGGLDLPIGDEVFFGVHEGNGNTRILSAVCKGYIVKTRFYEYDENGDVDLLKELNADLCMSCGTCSFVCPAKRPLAPSIALAKIMMKNGGKK